MKHLVIILNFLFLTNTTIFSNLSANQPQSDQVFLIKAGQAVYENVIDLIPFLSTMAISLVVAQLQPKDGAGNNNPFLKIALDHAAVAIPFVFSFSALYSRVTTIRDSRKHVGNNAEAQNALTRQQNEVIAKYIFLVPTSIFAAKRLASSPDAAARIAYIVGTYLIASGKGSPFDLFKSWVASMMDSYRLESNKTPALLFQ
ncbi:MAG TPA: hypothetical protein VHA52_04030 [Candidatus Babeliaceae bacterium]|nr:hypothetical protein [Candidatus Babeliaceae bacterium]